MIFHEYDPRNKLEPLSEPSSLEYQPVATLDQCQKLVQLCTDLGLELDVDVEARYWSKRLAYEEDKAKAVEQGLPEPHYFQVYERYDDHERLHILDPRRRLRIYQRAEAFRSLDLDSYGLTIESLMTDEEYLCSLSPPKLEKDYAISDLSTIEAIFERRRIDQKLDAVRQQLTEASATNPSVKQLIEADILEPVSLLESPIKKDDINPTMLAVVGGLAAKQYLDSYEKAKQNGEQTSIKMIPGTSQRNLSSITHRYFGNVGALIGTKLPVTNEFMDEYFDDELAEEVVPESVVRLQFDAVLKPDTKNPVISRVGTVIYEAVNENGDRRVVTTARKADRMLASLAIQSMIRESSAITDIVRSGRYEYLTGHPGLGKRR